MPQQITSADSSSDGMSQVIIELWGEAPDFAGLRTAVEAYPAARTAPYRDVSFKIIVDGYGKSYTMKEQVCSGCKGCKQGVQVGGAGGAGHTVAQHMQLAVLGSSALLAGAMAAGQYTRTGGLQHGPLHAMLGQSMPCAAPDGWPEHALRSP